MGGGIGNSKRVAALLNGTWSESYGLLKNACGCCLLGYRAYGVPKLRHQCREDRWSSGTKFVGRGLSVGGVRSGRSGLGADMHYVDNHAAKTSAFLDSVAVMASGRCQPRQIIAMLAKTAKPYFGDPCEMTYLEMLDRLVELMALGKGSHTKMAFG